MPREGEDRENQSEGQELQSCVPGTQFSQLSKRTETCYVPDTVPHAGGSKRREPHTCLEEQGQVSMRVAPPGARIGTEHWRMNGCPPVGEECKGGARWRRWGAACSATRWATLGYFTWQSVAFLLDKMGTTTALPLRVVRTTGDGHCRELLNPVPGT